MSARLSIGRTLAVAGVVTAVALPLSAGSAFAGPNPHHPPAPAANHHPSAPVHTANHHPSAPVHTANHHPSAPVHTANHHPRPVPHHDVVTQLRTRMRNAHIQATPTADRHGRTLSVLRASGSRVAVTCWTFGARVHGSKTWYRTVAPARGYISSTEVGRPARPVGRCR